MVTFHTRASEAPILGSGTISSGMAVRTDGGFELAFATFVVMTKAA
jgi:hypothetical protein